MIYTVICSANLILIYINMRVVKIFSDDFAEKNCDFSCEKSQFGMTFAEREREREREFYR
jgi:hypothetical protein